MTLPRVLAVRQTASSVVRAVQIDNATIVYEKQSPSVDALGEHQTPWVPATASDLPDAFLLRQMILKIDAGDDAGWPITVTE